MFRTTLKNLAARKLRLLTTSLAVLLGVAFMAGTLVLTDTIGKSFDDLFADVNARTSVYVRQEATLKDDTLGDQRGRLDASLVDDIAASTEKARSLGATIMKDVTEVPGMGWLSLFTDPEGRMNGLWKPMIKKAKKRK